MRKKELKFTIFIIYNLARKWKKTPQQVYSILKKTKILDDYIIKHYDTLHTLGIEYLIEDITEFVNERSVKAC